jgi:hypothetical protein
MATQAPASRKRLHQPRLVGDVEGRSIATRIGSELRAARRRRRLTQARVAELVGVHQSRISQIELGRGLGCPMGLWIGFGLAVGCPIGVSTGRVLVEPADAGHLAGQETILRLAKANAIGRTFELMTRPAPNAGYIDVCLRDDRHRTLIVVEIWNTIGDVGAATRSFKRKLLQATEIAANVGGDDGPYRVVGCWALRATAANRSLVARYPAVFASALPGASRAWARTLTTGDSPPMESGAVWIDLAGTRLFELRTRPVRR